MSEAAETSAISQESDHITVNEWKDFEGLEDLDDFDETFGVAVVEPSGDTPVPQREKMTTVSKRSLNTSSKKLLEKRKLIVEAILSGDSDVTSTSAKFIKLDETVNVDMQLLYTKSSAFLSLQGISNRADIKDAFPKSTVQQNGLRAALLYGAELSAAYNSGNLTVLRCTLDRICLPSCMLFTHMTHVQEQRTFPDLVVPAGQLFEYFKASMDSFPDGLWTFEESKAKVSNPITVSGSFQFCGTMLKAVYDVAFSSFNPDGHVRPTVDSPDAIKVVGVFVFALNDAFKVSKIDIYSTISVTATVLEEEEEEN